MPAAAVSLESDPVLTDPGALPEAPPPPAKPRGRRPASARAIRPGSAPPTGLTTT